MLPPCPSQGGTRVVSDVCLASRRNKDEGIMDRLSPVFGSVGKENRGVRPGSLRTTHSLQCLGPRDSYL